MFFIFSDNHLQIQVAKVFNNIDFFFFLKKNPIVEASYMCVCVWIRVETEVSIAVDRLTSLSLYITHSFHSHG